jgi:hypothetical protein
MGKWSTFLKIGNKAVNNSATRSIGGAIIHPQRTLAGAGTAMKTAVVGTGVGYLAWENIVNDKPVARSVSDVLIGEDNVDKTLDMASNAADKISSVTDKADNTLDGVNQATTSWGGIGNFLQNMTNGNGFNMFGNLFGNIAQGNVSGMSILGLLLSGWLVFGRTGWLGKIAGAIMSMMLIGSNSQNQQVKPTQEQSQAQSESQSSGHKR